MKRFITIVALLACSLVSAQKKKVVDLSGAWKFTIGDRQEYADPEFDDRSWESIKVPSPWEYEGFASYNGFAWYRKTFDGYALKDYQNLIMNLGYIDDVHEVYLNGELLGFKGSFPPDFYTTYDVLNEYAIPDDLINRNGPNVIAIKVYDLVKDGGIVKGDRIGIWFEPLIPREYLNLEGLWQFTERRRADWETAKYNDARWDKIIVPSFWRSKHIKRSSGNAYYRKSFQLPPELKGKDLYLLLGFIDDFDKTYVNGVLVGETNDGKPLGYSNSWQELRIYRIPKGLLNEQGRNVTAVEVEDLGFDAGIYKGPVGLVPESFVKGYFRGVEPTKDR